MPGSIRAAMPKAASAPLYLPSPNSATPLPEWASATSGLSRRMSSNAASALLSLPVPISARPLPTRPSRLALSIRSASLYSASPCRSGPRRAAPCRARALRGCCAGRSARPLRAPLGPLRTRPFPPRRRPGRPAGPGASPISFPAAASRAVHGLGPCARNLCRAAGCLQRRIRRGRPRGECTGRGSAARSAARPSSPDHAVETGASVPCSLVESGILPGLPHSSATAA